MLKALLVRRAFEEAVGEVCGDLPEEKRVEIKAVSFRDGALKVKCTGALAGEVVMRSRQLIKTTNEKLAKKAVFKLVVGRS